jgi:hypothetical protein
MVFYIFFSLRGDEGDASDGDDVSQVVEGTTKISSASPVDPQDIGDESDVGDEVMRDNKTIDLQKSDEIRCVSGHTMHPSHKVCFECKGPRQQATA